MKIFIVISKLLILGTPIFYFLSKLMDVSSIRFSKDFLIIVLGLFSVLINIKRNLFNRIFFKILFVFLIMVFVSLINFEDPLFYAISIRELVIYPVFYMSIGLTLSKSGISVNMLIYKSLIICFYLMVFFGFFFYSKSLGEHTGRFRAFFDGGHLPAIFSSLIILYVIFYQKNKSYKLVLIIVSFLMLLMTGTRSALLFLIIVYSLYAFKFSVKSIFSLIILGLVFLTLMAKYFERDVFYNLEARIFQYNLAWQLIQDNFVFGIGIDKYGVLGSFKKKFVYGNFSTVTMDSSFFKYVVNLGVPLTISYLLVLFSLIKKVSKKEKVNILIKRVMLFSLLMGTVTGKFGAYPLNMIFFMNIPIMINKIK